MKNISIVIPNLNGESYLKKFIISLNKAIHSCPTAKFQIIFVDNHSTDSSLKIIKNLLPQSTIIKLSKNFGFAKAVNQGITKAIYPYVCVLNNDLVLKTNWFKELVPLLNPKIGSVSSTVKNYSGLEIESQGINFLPFGKCLQIKHNPNNFAWGSSAAAVIYYRPTIIKIGLFDEQFFAYLEDVDLAYRLSNLNLTTHISKKTWVYHYGGGTSDKFGNFRSYYSCRNWFYFIIKHYSFKQIFDNFPLILIERLRNLSYLIKSTSFIKLPYYLSKLFLEIIVYLLK
ncbi:MAG TPA: glycosyltransferase family 2 protein [Candidatus Woesebacteria bacterium]|nr:glycosyltransferase family 2 protein [Candidatus Woesebacteria bacterium]HPJ17025.1 glycosyltransferase family 2 protein [Candidatus Woesebacteria bacterium]